MKSTVKRYLAFFMAFVMCLSLMPSYAFAEDEAAQNAEISEDLPEAALIDDEPVDIVIMPEEEVVDEEDEPIDAEEFLAEKEGVLGAEEGVLEVTPGSSVKNASAIIAKGDDLTLRVKSDSTSTYNYSLTIDGSDAISIDKTSAEIKNKGNADFIITGLENGEAVIFIEATRSGSSSASKYAVVCVTVGTGMPLPSSGDEVTVTPESSNPPSIAETIDVGGCIILKITNSSSSDYAYTATVSNPAVAKVNKFAIIEGKGTGNIGVTGLANGSTTITISNNNSSSERTATIELTVSDGSETPITDAVVTLEEGPFTYTGSAIKPEVDSVVLGGESLTANVDYTVSYENNTKAGESTAENPPTVKITGKGNYKGTVEKTFSIDKAELSFTASADSPSIGVGMTTKISLEGNDSTGEVTYSSDKTDIASVDNDGTITGVAIGEAEITVNVAEDSNYNAGSAKATVNVIAAKKYIKVESLTDGNNYLIVSSNEAGGAKALKNGGISSGSTSTSASVADVTIVNNGGELYVSSIASNIVWTATQHLDGYTLTNNGNYLDRGNSVKIYSSQQDAEKYYWAYSDNQMQHCGGSKPYNLYYSNNAFTLASGSTKPVYIFEEDDGIPRYTITFKNYDDTVLQTVKVKQGDVPEYTGTTPKKPSDAQYSYTFNGWDSEVVAATADATYKATFTQKELVNRTFNLVNSIEAGKNYIIVSSNAEGSAYALKNNGGTSEGTAMADTEVTVVEESGTFSVQSTAEDIIWTATANSSGFNLTNNGDYLEGRSGKVYIYTSLDASERYWTYSDNVLQHNGGHNTPVVYYDENAFTYSTSTTEKVYIYEEYEAPEPVDISGAVVTLTIPESGFVYTGKEIEPSVASVVLNGTTTLTTDDYDVILFFN